MRCIRCHHPMKHATKSGMGKVCEAKAGKPIPAVDLFTPRLDANEAAARAAVSRVIDAAAVRALLALSAAFAAARRRMMA